MLSSNWLVKLLFVSDRKKNKNFLTLSYKKLCGEIYTVNKYLLSSILKQLVNETSKQDTGIVTDGDLEISSK